MKDECSITSSLGPTLVAGEGTGVPVSSSTVAIITDIHRSSVVDGPGIRTTVFLKGCPLTCVWCHNPETQQCHRQLGFNASKCTVCRECVGVCPQSALSLNGGALVVDRPSCNDCLDCVDVCPTEALFAYGRTVTVDEVLNVVLKDKLYFKESGGGLTISGGEPMMQAEFTIELLKRCKDTDIHTCLDTTGVGRSGDFNRTLDYTDLYLFDYKATDPEALKKLTGASQKAIMRTFHMLYNAGARIRLRCPMIPNVNDGDEHLKAIAELSRNYDLDGIEILCWHTMGGAKYGYLGRTVSADLPKENTDDARKSHYAQVLADANATGVVIQG